MTPRSEKNLTGVHPDLVRVIRLSHERLNGPLSFIVTEGLRTYKRQQQLVAAGASRTMNSRHLTGHAVDIAATVNGEVRWDWPLYTALSQIIKHVAEQQSVPIVWGGDWKSFRDGPHYELSRKKYP